jgi:hypothetical protein
MKRRRRMGRSNVFKSVENKGFSSVIKRRILLQKWGEQGVFFSNK